MIDESRGFTLKVAERSRPSYLGRRKAVPMDSSEITTLISSGLDHFQHHQQHVNHESMRSIESILSTMYTSTQAMLKPAHGHSQPFWGPPDPYLSGKSLAPPAKALLDMGIQKSDDVQLLAPDVQAAAAKGWKLLDSTRTQVETILPGFAPTRGILPYHDRIPDETDESFAAQVDWAARYLNVIDKIPYAAFAYGLVEFFLLRPNLDLYKEDIEAEPTRTVMDTVTVTGVRVGVFAVIALVTVGMFSG